MSTLTYQNKTTGQFIVVRRIVDGSYIFDGQDGKVKLTKHALKKSYKFVPANSKFRKSPTVPDKKV